MRRKLVAVVVGGTIAGAVSALVALAAFSGHSETASDGTQPSTLLESANGSGGATIATDPGSPAQTGGFGPGGGSGTVGRTQHGGGSVVAHGLTPTLPPAPSGGGQSGSGGGTPVQGVLGNPVPSGPVPVTLPGLPTSTPSPGAPAQGTGAATPTPAPASTSTSTSTTTSTSSSSGGGIVTVQVPTIPVLPLPTPKPTCVLSLLCLR